MRMAQDLDALSSSRRETSMGPEIQRLCIESLKPQQRRESLMLPGKIEGEHYGIVTLGISFSLLIRY